MSIPRSCECGDARAPRAARTATEHCKNRSDGVSLVILDQSYTEATTRRTSSAGVSESSLCLYSSILCASGKMPGSREQHARTAAVGSRPQRGPDQSNTYTCWEGRGSGGGGEREEGTRLTLEQMDSQDFHHQRFCQSPMDVAPPELELTRVRGRSLSRQEAQERVGLLRFHVHPQGPDVPDRAPDGRSQRRLIRRRGEPGKGVRIFRQSLMTRRAERRRGGRGVRRRGGARSGPRGREGRAPHTLSGLQLAFEVRDLVLQYGDSFCVAAFFDLVPFSCEAPRSAEVSTRDRRRG